MKLVNILDVVKIANRSVDKFSGVKRYIATGDLSENIISSYTELTYDNRPSRANVAVKTGQVIFARMQGTKKVLLIDNDNVDFIYSTGFCVFEPSKAIMSDYLRLILNSDLFQKQKDKYSKGATQKAINNAGLKKIQIPLPPLETQKKIVEVLDKAQELIDARKEQIRLMDELIQSIFYEMFGDPVTNPKGWQVCKMSSLGLFKNGMNFSSSDSGVTLNCLGVGDFKSLYKIAQTELLPTISLKQIPSEDYMLRNKDIVFVRSNGNKALIGRSVIIYPNNNEVTFSGFCIRLRVESDLVHEEFLIQLLRSDSLKNKLLRNGRGANIFNLNQKMLSDVDIVLPPKELQMKFIKIIEKIENQKSYMELSLAEHEMSFQSIMKASF
ncbi:type I restriction enzyme S subunit [Alkalibaculum bacchi]|uniref:Type I restriction enzyme S subunit n=1 Tax=Alkalibaculum bacchi TaxID=645887 RepID=A0A366I072_9FIRM|nr:restriction endonuclease subunit S [Alkalibaculum bacchi]RBP60366.1 type I restriction enzyme S subunit [Alkalibaculum bacchi]